MYPTPIELGAWVNKGHESENNFAEPANMERGMGAVVAAIGVFANTDISISFPRHGFAKPGAGDHGHGEDDVRHVIHVQCEFFAQNAVCGTAPFRLGYVDQGNIHGRISLPHIADGIDVRHVGLHFIIDLDVTALIQVNICRLQVQATGIWVTSQSWRARAPAALSPPGPAPITTMSTVRSMEFQFPTMIKCRRKIDVFNIC